MRGKCRLVSVLCATRRYPWFLHPPWLPVSPDLGHQSSAYLVPYPAQDHSCWRGCTAKGALNNITCMARPRVWACWWFWILPFHPCTTQWPQRLQPFWLKIKASSGLFHHCSPPFQNSAGPDTASSAIPEAALLELAITILLVSKRSHLKVRMDMPVGQSCLSVTTFWSTLLQNRILMPCAQMGSKSHYWIPICKIPNNASATWAIFLLLFSHVFIYVSMYAFCIPVFILKRSVPWLQETNKPRKHLRAAERRKPKQNKTLLISL